MLLGKRLLFAAIGEVDKRFIKANHESFFFVDNCFVVIKSKALVVVTYCRVDAKEFVRNGVLIGENKTDDIWVIGEDGDKVYEFFDTIVRLR